MSELDVAQVVMDLFERHGSDAYFGEEVSQLEHALQSAALAAQEGGPEYLQVAALLHDIGHLLHDEPEDIAQRGVDARHEIVGDRWLQEHFDKEVCEPVLLHVAAKRYLCAVEAGYEASLSAASVQSLYLQGGPFTAQEVAEFERNPHYADAIRLRRWDDMAKVVGLQTPCLETYRPLIERLQKRD